jgi:uncharacterized membrane protein YeiH
VVLAGEFQLPESFDLTATFLFAITGTLAGMRRHYDIIGVFTLAFVTALGGGLLRDGVFISSGPPVAVTSSYYLPVVAAAVIGTILVGSLVPPVRRILNAVPTGAEERVGPGEKLSYSPRTPRSASPAVTLLERLDLERHLTRTYLTILSVVDALGLGIYAVVGAQKSLNGGLPLGAAILIGTMNAVGGGLLRDVLTREVPLLFKPGQFYALTAAAGSVIFVALAISERIDIQHAAFSAISTTFVLRVLAIRFDWRSRAVIWKENEADG